MSQHAYGEPWSIIKFNDSANLEFDQTKLNRLLNHPKVKERKVVLVSIVGAFRKGKSFFLDYCLRYMYANYKSIENFRNRLNASENWFGAEDEPLRGFSWRSGTRRETTGIVFWSDVFLHDKPNGEKLAILLVDTQGLFDDQTSTADNSKIFSLSTLLASVQILNLHGLVQEDHLQYLQFATEFAKFNTGTGSQDFKPFQSFLFLLRDFNDPDEYPFGVDGGQKYLDDLLVVKPTQHEDLKSVRNFIKASFDHLSCCLLPYPGKTVARDSTYDGRWSLMDSEFRDELKALIQKLLSPDNLVTKKINNVEMTAGMANEFFQQYISLYRAGSSVQPQSIYETTIDKFMMTLVSRCFDIYKSNVSSGRSAIVDEKGIELVFNSSKEAAFVTFDAERKMGTNNHAIKYRNILDQNMNDDSLGWKALVLAGIVRVRAERQRAEEAAREGERLRLQREREAELAQERIAQMEREAREREAEAARQREDLREKQLAIKAEQNRQRELLYGFQGFQATVDVHHFQPSEVAVKTVDNTIIVEGWHEERGDQHGSIQRHFIRKFTLSEDYDPISVITNRSSDGVLTIKAPLP